MEVCIVCLSCRCLAGPHEDAVLLCEIALVTGSVVICVQACAGLSGLQDSYGCACVCWRVHTCAAQASLIFIIALTVLVEENLMRDWNRPRKEVE